LKKIIFRLAFIFFTLIVFSCNNNPVSKIDFFLGTICEVRIYDKRNKKILNEVFDIIKKIDSNMSVTNPDSEISQINKNAGNKSIVVSEDTFLVIKKGKYYSSFSDGLFDITSGPLIELWSVGKSNQKKPEENEVKNAVKLIDYRKIILNESNNSIFLGQNGIKLDLGGIAKGYTADKIYEYLKQKKIKSALINLGGNVYAIGNKKIGKEWNIGIQNPFEERGSCIGILKIKNKAVITSGKYERFFEENGIKYHHIFDTKTGYPSRSDLASVTIVDSNAMRADALSTCIFLMGYKHAKVFLENVKDINAVLINEKKEIYLTQKLLNNFVLNDENFKLIK
jgi:thiamine biosynthesis lipoprotein